MNQLSFNAIGSSQMTKLVIYSMASILVIWQNICYTILCEKSINFHSLMQPAYYWLVMTHERVVIIVGNKGFLGHWPVIIPTYILVVEHFEEDLPPVSQEKVWV